MAHAFAGGWTSDCIDRTCVSRRRHLMWEHRNMSDRASLPEQFRPYAAASRFGVITLYFNPSRYLSKLRNYLLFRESLKVSGIPCITIECHLAGAGSDLAGLEDVHFVASRDVMWQKERLANLAIERLPKEWTRLAWLDCDIFFENWKWAIEAVEQLENHSVVQLFSEVVRLSNGQTWGSRGQKRWGGFVAVKTNRDRLRQGELTKHGLTGFAWATHREILEQHGLYDGCIAGGGDHLMAHAFAGDWTNPCVDRTLCGSMSRRKHFTAWAQNVDQSVRSKVSNVSGTIFHLWHGDIANRQYEARHLDLARLDFDPVIDLQTGEGGCWEWASDKPELHLWVKQYFASRKEDGDAGG
jgi:hypothetical protein